MPRSCAVYGYKNKDTKQTRNEGIKFYRILIKKEKRRRWLSAINRKDFDPPPDACICSAHFVAIGGMKHF